ncbi:hypothetical protein JTB14_034515 [Gonioctena quinquepunctata]|nr:hypothetical protein JTB14_034515 [Gonioctena quinquepunctata]
MPPIWVDCESNMKAVKTHLFRVIGGQLLTYEEFSPLAQIEALFNSRPLCQLSGDLLAPAHFLTLAPLNSVPAEDVTTVEIGRLDRFQLIDRIFQDYWKLCQLEYLHTLQESNETVHENEEFNEPEEVEANKEVNEIEGVNNERNPDKQDDVTTNTKSNKKAKQEFQSPKKPMPNKRKYGSQQHQRQS